MASLSPSQPVRVAFIGVGAVVGYHHLPGLRLDPRARLAAICDADPALLPGARRNGTWSTRRLTPLACAALTWLTRS